MNSSHRPLVSVIVCVYNAGGYLRPSIESVIEQTYKNIEIIIVDDGSTDGCMKCVDGINDSRIRIIRQANKGKPTAMNEAMAVMSGDFYALHDADDISAPSRIEKQIKALIDNADVAAVFCGHELILGEARMAPLHRAKDRNRCRRDVEEFRMPGHDPTAMYRVSMVQNIQYSADLPIVEGFDYILRVGEKHPMLCLSDCLYLYRIHNQSVTRRNPAQRDELVHKVLVRACTRRGLDANKLFGEEWKRKKVSMHSNADNNVAAHFMDSVCDLRRMGEIRKSIRTGLECVRLHPFDPHYHKALVYAVSPRWLINRVRRNHENT